MLSNNMTILSSPVTSTKVTLDKVVTGDASKKYSEQSNITGKDVTEDNLSEWDKPFTNYKEVAQPAIKCLKGEWQKEIDKTKERRKKRYFDIDVEKERAAKHLEEDELFIPVAIVNTNIIREQAKYAAYLTKSARAVILTCNEDASVDATIIERDYTQKSRYNAWEMDFLRWIDGTETHGWDFVEVVFDSSKPGHFYNEHCSHDNILFPTDTKDFQASPFVIRFVPFTTKDLIKFSKTQGWNKEQVYKVLSGCKDKNKYGTSLHILEKIFYRGDDGFIYVGWSHSEFCDDWLREPRMLFLGKTEKNEVTGKYEQLFETAYPLEPFLYIVSENQMMMETKGRVDLDEHKQEAATSLLSSFCTSHRRASEMYWTTDNNDGTSPDEAQTDIKLKANRLINKNLKQWQLKPSDPSVMGVINTLIGQSQMESGDVNYAIASNKSTRKTAAEVNMAKEEGSLLSGVQVTLLSIALRNVHTRNFDIYIHRIKAGLIKVTQSVFNLATQYTWTLKPAGDTDVIERQQKISLMQQAWAVYQNTPVAKPFLINLTKLLFPDEAQQYIDALEMNDIEGQKNSLIQEAAQFIMTIVIDPTTGQLKQEYAAMAPTLMRLQNQMVVIKQQEMQGVKNGTEGSELSTPDNVEELKQNSIQ
jgi:hypothetical protein